MKSSTLSFHITLPKDNAPNDVHNNSIDRRTSGEYISRLQHTLGHLECPACDLSRMVLMQSSEFSSERFEQASAVWLESRIRYISPRTAHDYKQYLSALVPFFGSLTLEEIHIVHIREYQKQRSEKAGSLRVNHELGAMQQILKRAGLWAAIEAHYETLPISRPKPGKAISPEDEDRLFLIASKKPRWKVAYWASSLTANTTAGPGEIRHLRIGDVDLNKKLLYIREGTKNEFRVRKIPLNDRAFKMVCRLLERADKIAKRQKQELSGDDYLLPHLRRNGMGSGYDFQKPMFSWRCAWNSLREAAGLKKLRLYDLRHLAITKLLENPDVSEETARAIAGHISRQSMMHYSHVRQQAMTDAVKALEAPGSRLRPVRMKIDPYWRPVEKKDVG